MLLLERERDGLFCPYVVHNDPYGRFFMMEIKYFGVLIWLVRIYAPNNVNQCIELWYYMYPRLSLGCVGFLMSDFNMCIDAS